MLLLFYRATPQQASGASLAAGFVNALSGTLDYPKQRKIDSQTGRRSAAAAAFGLTRGAWRVDAPAG